MMLELGKVLKTLSGSSCKIIMLLGSFCKGEIYQVTVNEIDYELKWYFPNCVTPKQREILENILDLGSPGQEFFWPIDIVLDDSCSFGYIMELREPRFKSLFDLMNRKIDPSFRILCRICYKLSEKLSDLHANGLFYGYITLNDVLIDPVSGDIKICGYENFASQGVNTIIGTPKFMAPELVRGETLPSIETELFSLAVLFFYILMINHPLEGEIEAQIKVLNQAALTKLYGSEPIFIFDPKNDSNRPVPGCHDNAIAFWPIYPQFLKDLFTRSFTDGIKDPQNGRVSEGEWRKAFLNLNDSIIYCNKCSKENFFDVEKIKMNEYHVCWHDNETILLPPRIRIGQKTVMLNYNSRIYNHHLDGQPPYNTIISQVIQSPSKSLDWGLKNISLNNWKVAKPNGVRTEVAPGKSVTISNGLKINFGNIEGEIIN